MAKNTITGENEQVYKDDPRWLTGELVGVTKGQLTWCTSVKIDNEIQYAKYWYTKFGVRCKELLSYLDINKIKYEI